MMPNILVVDDDIFARKMLRDCLEFNGYDVTEASNGEKALKLALIGPVDAVITDILMPEMDGIQVIRELHQRSPRIKIIAVSGGGQVNGKTLTEWAKKLGADVVLTKPIDIHEMLAALKDDVYRPHATGTS